MSRYESKTQYRLKQRFKIATTAVEILQGDVRSPGVDVHYIVSADDNYLTMGSGVSAALREQAGPEYVREAQDQSPVLAGTIVVTRAHDLANLEPLRHLRNVLHGTVIDYDSENIALEQLVYQATANSLSQTEELIAEALAGGEETAEWSILFTALGTGSGELPMDACARQMCSAIVNFLTASRLLNRIYIILYDDPARQEQCKELNQQYVASANRILGVPNDPARQKPRMEDIWERTAEVQQLREIMAGKSPQGKRHALILGGPRIGKSLFLDQVLEQIRRDDDPLGRDLLLVRLSFGRLHHLTPASFIYQKLLHALGRRELEPEMQELIRTTFANIGSLTSVETDESIGIVTSREIDQKIAEESSRLFIEFLDAFQKQYPKIVFFIDNLPVLMEMEVDEPTAGMRARAFWRHFDKLGERMQFICTARDDIQYMRLFERLSDKYKGQVLAIRLKCAAIEERKSWVNGRHRQYLGRSATPTEHRFIEEEAGLHPYLIGLASFALIKAIKLDEIATLKQSPERPGQDLLARFFRQARLTLDEPRRDYFAQLMAVVSEELLTDLRNLSRATAREDELAQLNDEILQLAKQDASDPNVKRRVDELAAMEDFRKNLHQEALKNLEGLGYVVKNGKTGKIEFMAKPFGLYVLDYFRTLSPTGQVVKAKDLSISLLWNRPDTREIPELDDDPAQVWDDELSMIRTMLSSRGARVLAAQKRFSLEIKREFISSFNKLVDYRLHPARYDHPGDFRDLEEVGNYILTQFTTVEIKKQLQELPLGSTILLKVDDALKDIPWELMLETAYASEIPFRVGRAVISSREPIPTWPAVRGNGKIKALLIADPTGNEKANLPLAREAVNWLRETLNRDDRFSEPDVLIGAEECKRIHLLNHLSSGDYGLVHYSGHSYYEGERSAWQLKDGEITTDQLTNAVQMAPPALVFSSSCESSTAGESGEIEYEGHTFDLPSSFLQAGVEAYIGTLWNVYEDSAKRFTQEFYSAFLSCEHNLGECMRRAKWALKSSGQRRDRIIWLAFMLYGDPHIDPGDLFPTLRRQQS